MDAGCLLPADSLHAKLIAPLKQNVVFNLWYTGIVEIVQSKEEH